mgnify:CR=1 FL=1
MTDLGDTIFALGTAPGRAGIAVLRLSGPKSRLAVEAVTGRPAPAPRRAVLRSLSDPVLGEAIDRGIVLWLPGPATFSGEDMAEFHIHGGRAVAAAMLRALGRLEGLRPAEPGEFSRRAFEHGRLDLTEVEGIADLVAAETEAQRRQALRQLSGALGELCEGWRGRALKALAHVEAAIDFPDEDLPTNVVDEVRGNLSDLQRELTAHLDDDRRGERLREGVSVAVIGPPNAGKSSLLNWLVRREAAIVSAKAGTTRDVIEVHLDLGGYPVVLADTAGLREADDEVEAEGVRRALARAACADLRLVVLDATTWPELDPRVAGQVSDDAIVVVNKTDLRAVSAEGRVRGRAILPVSIRTGAGLDALLKTLESEVSRRVSDGAAPEITRERHRRALEECAEALGRAEAGLVQAAPVELVAEDLRLAVRALGRITGKVDVEDMLDIVFAEFCIGK